jgi:hypothetical protein
VLPHPQPTPAAQWVVGAQYLGNIVGRRLVPPARLAAPLTWVAVGTKPTGLHPVVPAPGCAAHLPQ